ncbi:MAG TPA: hypothetical protein VFP37_15855 [Steroidobacteraceae bacterium]|nr:hypothetical protein [Steroidobacteraceae bacterium]
MRRLTLILSDLYLQEEALSGGVPQAQAMPALAWLLRHAQGPHRTADWRRWLLQQIGGGLAEQRLAALCAGAAMSGQDPRSAWLATPVALEARLDHVRLMDRGLLRLDAEERLACRTEFNQVFGPDYSLHDCGERAFALLGVAPLTAEVADPARWLGAEIGPALPGADSSALRRVWAEIEMWLHGSALNRARERAGRRRIAALWLWGGDRADRPGPQGGGAAAEIHGGDPLMHGLRRLQQLAPRDPPAAFAQLEAAPHVIAEFAALTGPARESLAALEANWFAPARDALARGSLSLLEIIANDRRFAVTPRARWRFWRRRRDWLDSLAHSATRPKA